MELIPKINFKNINNESISGKSKELKKTNTKKNIYLPDNYYTYDVHRHLNTDFHNLKPDKNTIIYICPFRIVESQPNKIIDKPFLQYLLYKYPKSKTKTNNLCIFPFQKYISGEILDIGNKIVKKMFNSIYNSIGYIKNKDGIFLFYNIDFTSVIITNTNLTKKEHFIWTLIDEICNQKKIITFPIHRSVTNLLLNNPKLIYLKDKHKKCIEIPTVAYIGAPQELLNYIATLGIKSSTVRTFGPYYYFSDFKSSIRNGAWTSNYEERIIFNKPISDENGKFIQGGIVRFAIFLGNYRVVMDRQNDPMYKYIKVYDKVESITNKELSDIKKNKGKWASVYDTIIISNFKNKKKSGYFWPNTGYILKKFNHFISLSIHLIDNTSLKPNWDMNYDGYNII